MELELKEQLLAFKDELTHFQTDDILVHVSIEKTLGEEEINDQKNEKTQRILRDAHRIFREIGVQPFCQSMGILKSEKNGKNIQTPIFLRDVPLQFRKSNIELPSEIETGYYLNPYFDRWFRKEFEETPPTYEDRENLTAFFEREKLEYDLELIFYGNFHPQRYELLKEVEDLILCEDLSEPLKQLLGYQEVSEAVDAWEIQPPYLFPFDPSQEVVFQALNHSSVTVQGPPGTGKSQVISNLIGSCIAQNKRVLIVSEKKAALTVLQQKLAQRNLGFLCSYLSFQGNLNAFYSDLKSTWEFLSMQEIGAEPLSFDATNEVKLAQQFNAIKLFEAQNECSLDSFLETIRNQKEHNFMHGHFPSIHTWKRDHEILHKLAASTIESLPFLSIEWKNNHKNGSLFQAFHELEDLYAELSKNFQFLSIRELQDTTRQAIQCQQFQGNIYKKYGRFLGKDSIEIKKYIKQWKKRNAELEACTLDQAHWLKEPSLAELDVLKDAALKTGIFAGMKWKSTWKKWTRTPGLEPFQAISSKEKQLKLLQSKIKLTQTLTEMGISNVDIELPIIEQLLEQNSMDDWNWYQNLSQEKRTLMANSHRAFSQLNQALNELLKMKSDTTIGDVFLQVKDALPFLQKDLPFLSQLSNETWGLFEFHQNLEDINEGVYRQTWKQFVEAHPYMHEFEWTRFRKDTVKILSERQQTEQQFAKQLIRHQGTKFAQYQEILSAPLHKLSKGEKELRGILRKGKSILVKEFGKSRQHMNIRELRKSEAKWWLDCLKPIQLSNPSSLASIYPMEKDQFDLLIFDEAGQIPMSYALGALQRAKRVVVAGDHQQMSPSSYFRKTDDVVIDVLHQSAFHFKNVLLTRHYRSRNPQLIAFSNQHFYGGRLRTFAEKSSDSKPLIYTYVNEATYENRVNLKEAKMLARKLEKALLSKDKYGVVAFSEAQLAAIYAQLSSKSQMDLMDAVAEDRIFFKALEQVQGEECDHLLISFAYARNSEGKFEMRFGPLNLVNGAKRLNVLFSRAKSSIEFICSVKSSDFGPTKNEGVLRLRDWFVFIENQSENQNNLEQEHYDFKHFLKDEDEFQSFLNRFDVLRQRGWELP